MTLLHKKKRLHTHFVRAAMLIGLLLQAGAQVLNAGSPQAADAIEAADPAGADFFVSPDGDDAWSGTFPSPRRHREDGPFATLARAQEAVREAGRKEPEALIVRIREGVYTLTEPIVFHPEDSGTAEAPITYANHPNEQPVFIGGHLVTGWEQQDENIWIAHIPEVESGEWHSNQLFVNGKRQARARTPNEGYFRAVGPHDDSNKIGFYYQEGDLQSWTNLNDAIIHAYFGWHTSRHYIQDLDEDNQRVTVTPEIGSWIDFGDNRYYVENVPEALDQPGEWYLDRDTGMLHYWAPADVDMTETTAVLPFLETLLTLEGNPSESDFVEHLVLRGLSFQYADYAMLEGTRRYGEVADQGSLFLGAAVMAWNARDVRFEGIEVAHVGGYGVWIGEGSQRVTLDGAHIHNLGAGGVRIGMAGGQYASSFPRTDDPRSVRNNKVTRSYIHNGGNEWPSGKGVWIGGSSYNVVSHNDISDFLYTGVNVGWHSDGDPEVGRSNIIEFNHIYDIAKDDVVHDLAGIYTLQPQRDTIIRNNLVHDVYDHGLYADNNTAHTTWKNNIVYNTNTGFLHKGKDNTVINNIFIQSGPEGIHDFDYPSRFALYRVSEEEGDLGLTFKRNIVVTSNGNVLGWRWERPNFEFDHNLYWDTEGNDLHFWRTFFPPRIHEMFDIENVDRSFSEWQDEGQDVNSVIADPGFVDMDNRNFELEDDSPAFDLGFRPIDTESIGPPEGMQWLEAQVPTAPGSGSGP